ncbi:MAG: hypothetical protein LUD46_07515, partial [Parabacteroides sp.]|nr:hypothetical protein [Parabacteroides sp.]
GVCGNNYKSITGCYNTGSVTANNAGGVCGRNQSSTPITDSGYLEGSAEEGIGYNVSSGQPEDLEGAQSLTPANLVNKLNEIDTWKGKGASYKNGILTLPTLGDEDAPTANVFILEPDGSNTCYIYTADHLCQFAKLVNDKDDQSINAKLMNNITLSGLQLDADGTVVGRTEPGEQWTPIGTKEKPFTGTFDGDGKKMKGIYIKGDADYQGLFGRLGTNGEIKNVGVVDSYIEGNNYIGGVCGRNNGGTISDCYNTGSVTANATSTDAYAGGVYGNNSSSISNCYNTGSVTATSTSADAYAGGVCGVNSISSSISNSGYLKGSAEKGIGNKEESDENAQAYSLERLADAINEAFFPTAPTVPDSPWKSQAEYKDGQLTLPSFNEDGDGAPVVMLAIVTEYDVNKANLIDYINEKIKADTPFEVSREAEKFTPITASDNKIEPEETLYIRYKDGKHNGMVSDILEMTLPERPKTPGAPTESAKTHNSITLNVITGAEYKCGEGDNWQESNTFTGLAPKTEYTFYARIKATDSSFASKTSEGAGITTAAEPEPEPKPKPEPEPDPDPVPEPDPAYYSYTIPTVTGAIVEGAGSDEAREGTRISFRIHLDPRGNGIYPTATANYWWNNVQHDGNGTYSFRLYEDTRIEIGVVDYTLYEVDCPADTLVNADGTYTTGAGITVTDASGHAAQAFPYAATVKLNAPTTNADASSAGGT